MKKILTLIYVFLFSFSFPFTIQAEDLFSISAKCGNVENNIIAIYKQNLSQGTEELMSNEIPCFTGISYTNTQIDPVKGLFFLSHDSQFTIYDYVNNTYASTPTFSGTQNKFILPYSSTSLSDIITTGTDAVDNSSTTILGSLDISDSNGNTLIENKADGSVHIGENSLVTQEVNGVQQLYATNSAGNQIDLNIKSGTNLLIGGRNIMDIIGGDISGSVAMSSALTALPNSSPDAFYTCGLGTGFHDSSSALSAGCASDFSNYAFADNLPKIFQTASFNIGSSFLMNGEPDISEARDMSIKAGITFKFGSIKPTRVADRNNHMLENKIDAVMTENNLLKAQIAEINTQLKALNMLAMN